MPQEIVGEKIETEQMYDAINVLLSLRVRIILQVLNKHDCLNYSKLSNFSSINKP